MKFINLFVDLVFVKRIKTIQFNLWLFGLCAVFFIVCGFFFRWYYGEVNLLVKITAYPAAFSVLMFLFAAKARECIRKDETYQRLRQK